MPEAIYNPVVYFKNTYTDDWITDPLSKDMIRAVDRSEVIGPRVIDSPVLGGISPRELSGGVKTLIAMYNDTMPRNTVSMRFPSSLKKILPQFIPQFIKL